MSKYRSRVQVVDGVRFASQKEARRYMELKLLQRAGEIADLKLQPRIKCIVAGELVCTYVADFFYIPRGKLPVYEDVKGVRTPMYKLKKKLVKACAGVEIFET